ncbi:hypothetical protein PUN28_014832 [Cardiocondyla obscurior]|uniref:Uncharacterized protein n=1 Tax=Cardiocondyla obscurior TaxID=286306 RepID=A0AAW2F041_9HYME
MLLNYISLLCQKLGDHLLAFAVGRPSVIIFADSLHGFDREGYKMKLSRLESARPASIIDRFSLSALSNCLPTLINMSIQPYSAIILIARSISPAERNISATVSLCPTIKKLIILKTYENLSH